MLENRGSIEEHQTGLWKLSMGTCLQKRRDTPTIVGSKIEIIGCWILDGTISSATHHLFSHKVSNNCQSRSSNARINKSLSLTFEICWVVPLNFLWGNLLLDHNSIINVINVEFIPKMLVLTTLVILYPLVN